MPFISILLIIVLVYGILLVSGFWIFYLVTAKDNASTEIFTNAPVFGLAATSVYFSNTIGWGIPFTDAAAVFFALSVCGSSIAAWQRNTKHGAHLGPSRQKGGILKIGSAGVCLGAAVVIQLWPIIRSGLTTPWRIGPDASGYANCAEYLLANKSLVNSSADFLRPSEVYAFQFMFAGNRRSVPALEALISWTSHLRPTEVGYVLAVVLGSLTLLVVYKASLKVPAHGGALTAILVVLALAFNCNLLFILYEGCYAQVAAGPLLMVIFLRLIESNSNEKSKLAGDITVGFFVAALSSLYAESLALLAAVTGIFIFCQWVLGTRKPNIAKSCKCLGVIFATALALNWSIVSHWITWELQTVRLLKIPGWGQPQWAWAPQIFGLVDIYRHVVGNNPFAQNTVSSLESYASLGVTLGIFAVICIAMHRKSPQAIMSFAVGLVVIGSYYYFKEYKHLHSYAYMKIYTSLLPILIFCLVKSLNYTKRAWQELLFVGLFSAGAIYQGILFVGRFTKDFAITTQGLVEIYKIEETCPLDNVVVILQPDQDEHAAIRNNFIKALFTGKLADARFFPEQDFRSYQNASVAILRKRVAGLSSSGATMWSGTEYELIDTGIAIKYAWKDPETAYWGHRPTATARPALELQWAELNEREKLLSRFSFDRYFEAARKRTQTNQSPDLVPFHEK